MQIVRSRELNQTPHPTKTCYKLYQSPQETFPGEVPEVSQIGENETRKIELSKIPTSKLWVEG